jgi:nucleoid DNA-binding protein
MQFIYSNSKALEPSFCNEIIDLFEKIIISELARSEKVVLTGFGKFEVKESKSRMLDVYKKEHLKFIDRLLPLSSNKGQYLKLIEGS